MIKYTIKISISSVILFFLSCKENTKASSIFTEKVSSTADTEKIITRKELSDDKSNITINKETRNQNILNKWVGNYHFDLQGKGEREGTEYKINLNISKDSVIYYAEGYQLYQRFLLNALEENNTLALKYKESLDGTNSWALTKTQDFGKVYLKNGKYVWDSPFLNISFTNNQNITYSLINKDNK